MDTLDGSEWDILIAGTGIQQSLLALALSKSGKRILHIDQNSHYGGSEAAFSLQEAEEWVKKLESRTDTVFSQATISSQPSNSDGGSTSKLGFSRAYSVALAPHIIYTRSALLPLLVSSRSDQQLEFLAVGSWWVYSGRDESGNLGGTSSALSRVPNSREDLFADGSIEPRAKRSLMKFLRFIGDFENQPETWKDHEETPFHDFLSTRYNLPPAVQAPFQALILSPYPPTKTTTSYALPRIARHLRSIGLFGPGFGAVIPKWGGLAELAQVGCRAGAVGGAVYVLGTGVQNIVDDQAEELKEVEGDTTKPAGYREAGSRSIKLTNNDLIKTQWLAGTSEDIPQSSVESSGLAITATSRSISIVSTQLSTLFPPVTDGAPQSAVAVVVFPSSSLDLEGGDSQELPPVNLFVHSSETGECPNGQSVMYASIATPLSRHGSALLDKAVKTLISTVHEQPPPRILWQVQYEQKCSERSSIATVDQTLLFPLSSADLVFDDLVIEQVRAAWQTVVGSEGTAEGFMKFAAREEESMDDFE